MREFRIPKKYGRGGEIRTPDILVPNQARYQTALHPEQKEAYNAILMIARPLMHFVPNESKLLAI